MNIWNVAYVIFNNWLCKGWVWNTTLTKSIDLGDSTEGLAWDSLARIHLLISILTNNV